MTSDAPGRPATRGTVHVYETFGTWTRRLRATLPETFAIENEGTVADWLTTPASRPVVTVLVPTVEQEPIILQRLAHLEAWLRDELPLIVITDLRRPPARYFLAAGIMLVDDRWLTRCTAVSALIRRLCEMRQEPALSLEQQIWKNLPWRPLS